MKASFVMRKEIARSLLPLLPLLTACASGPVGPQRVAKSLYLHKRYMKFEVDNGPSYRDVRLSDGSTRHYWRSDFGNLLAIATGRDKSYPDYCELRIESDAKGIVRRIEILENSIQCNGVLK